MKPKPIGIVAGAGPLAGVSLLERLFYLSKALYGCYKDGDFPEITLISFPFSEMLSEEIDAAVLQEELSRCLHRLRKNGAEVLAIACNTLHAFLEEKEERADLLSLPKIIAKEIPQSETALIFCTSTSRKYNLHRQFFPCAYPDSSIQVRIDKSIQQILQMEKKESIVKELLSILEEQRANVIVLGCTELSIFSKYFSLSNKLIIDPLDILAKKIIEKSFSKQ